MPNRVIPLESVPPGGGDNGGDGPLAFTDVVVLLHLENAASHTRGRDSFFESDALAEAAVAAFGLGCAVGVDFPARILPILEQTHPGEVERIVAECAEPLERQVAAARQATEALAPEDFLHDLLETLEESEHADAETAQNAVSMSFEYGLLLANASRSAALVLRNALNRATADALRAASGDGDSDDEREADSISTPSDMEAEPPFESLQELAAEMVSAYEADIGFGE